MPINSSFPKVADQVIAFNKNLVDILSKINDLTTTTDSTVNIQIYDEEGVLRNFSLPSFSSLKGEIDRLNNNINSLYSIDANGALIQTTNANKFKKIITVDLNRDPIPVGSLGSVSKFQSKVNWFFDSMVDPMMQVEIDLSYKIEDNVSKSLVRRYIVEFERDNNGLTLNGQSALNSFNLSFRGNSNIVYNEFETWHQTTPGVVWPLNPRYDEDTYDLELNNTLYDGEFTVLSIQEDRLNRKLWYILNTLDYIIVEDSSVKQLAIDDEIIINSAKTSTRYKIIEVSTSESNPKIRVEVVEGIEPIPVGVGTIKIYSPLIHNKKVKINISYAERNIIFLKPINTENNLVAKKWSFGSGFYTNDLRVESDGDINGLTMEQFYTGYVYDYGQVLKDMVTKNIPTKLAGVPSSPSLETDNFKVVQVNKHLTDTPNSELIKQKHNYQNSLKSEIKQIESAVLDRTKKVKVSKFKSEADKKQYKLEIGDLNSKKESTSKLLTTVTQEIIDISRQPLTKVEPKFRLRGFWEFPDAVIAKGTLPQEIIQFIIESRYVSKDGTETSIEQYKVVNEEKASFSNWKRIKTEIRKRIYDSETEEYYWEVEDLENPDVPNINQLDIPIQSGERVEFRIKSISEVGWPDSPAESDWSEILSYEFPDDLDSIVNENEYIIQQANKEDVKLSVNSELAAKGLDDHLANTVIENGVTFDHDASKILSGFKDDNSVALDLFTYLKSLEDKIKSLEEKISSSKGILDITILRNNEEYKISNGSETVFNIECEDYLDNITGDGIPTGRVYENSIYIIRDFVLRIKNSATSSPLGLLSDKNYLQNSNVFNSNAPQVFWVNEQDELLRSDISTQTRTHLNNQFLWMINYDAVSGDTISKLSSNIENSFTTISPVNNSITNILSTSEYNVGYNETTILSFDSNNDSLLDPGKWIDQTISVDSSVKLLTTIHPVIKDLETLVENNYDKIKEIDPGDENDIIVPLNIYFKMNAMNTNNSGQDFEYINLNRSTSTIKHFKKVKFLLENKAENRPFSFTIKFNMSRNKVILRKTNTATNELIK